MIDLNPKWHCPVGCHNCAFFVGKEKEFAGNDDGVIYEMDKRGFIIGECANPECVWHGEEKRSFEGNFCPDHQKLNK